EGGAGTGMRRLSDLMQASVVVGALRRCGRWAALGGPRRAGWVLAVVAGPWLVRALWAGRWSLPAVAWAAWLGLAVAGFLSCGASWGALWEGSLVARWLTPHRTPSGDRHA
ncbi:MAG: hypothetical protein ACE5KY_03525, partial [Candidatus Tectimicrobiota bacterium]